MLVVKVLRPDCLSLIMEDYVRSVLGAALFESGLPSDILMQRYRVSGPSKPILLMNHNLEDPIMAIKSLSTRLSYEAPILVNIYEVEKFMEIIIPRSIVKGVWIIVEVMSGIDTMEHTLGRLIEAQRGQLLTNPSFRLWIVTGESYVPLYHFSVGVKIFMEETNVDFRSSLNDGFLALSGIRQNVSQEFKMLMFNLCVLYATFKFRMSTFPLIINQQLHISQVDLSTALKLMVSMYEENPQLCVADLFEMIFEKSWGASILTSADRQWCYDVFNFMMEIDWPSTIDRSEKSLSVPPLKEIYDAYLSNDTAIEKISSLPRGSDFNLSTLLYGDCIYVIYETNKSKSILSNFKRIQSNSLRTVGEIETRHEAILFRLTEFKSNLIIETKCSWFKGSEIVSVRTALKEKRDKNCSRQIELLTKENFYRYRIMIAMVIDALSSLIAHLSGEELNQVDTIQCIQEIGRDVVPATWKRSGYCYDSNLRFEDWAKDFLSRLAFLNVWYISKYEQKGSHRIDGPVFYDISKLFYPQDLFSGTLSYKLILALILDASVTMNEAVENLDLETVFIAERQTSPPSIGCYLTGLYLCGAAFDIHKNVIRDAKPNESIVRFPNVNDLNLTLDMVTSKSKACSARLKKIERQS